MIKPKRGGKYGTSKPSRGQITTQFLGKDEKVNFIKNDLNVSNEEALGYYKAIGYYTSYGYKDVRQWNSPSAQTAQKQLEDYISKSPTYNGEIYRGIHLSGKQGENFVNQLQKGAVIDMGGISSWSSELSVAKGFSHKSSEDYHVIFKCKNKSGVGIQHLSQFFNESEVLQSSKSKFKIKSVKSSIDKGWIGTYYTYTVELQEA